MDPLTEKIIFAAAGMILIPLIVGVYRWANKLQSRVQDTEAFIGFLKSYLLKDAVLQFRNNPHPDADEAIDKIVAGESVTPEEMQLVRDKLESAAQNAPDPRKRLLAQQTLDLMHHMPDWETAISEQSRARNDLFNA